MTLPPGVAEGLLQSPGESCLSAVFSGQVSLGEWGREWLHGGFRVLVEEAARVATKSAGDRLGSALVASDIFPEGQPTCDL